MELGGMRYAIIPPLNRVSDKGQPEGWARVRTDSTGARWTDPTNRGSLTVVKARADILILRPPEAVYLDVLTPGPVRVGSRAHQVRIDQGRQSESIFRVTALEELARLEFAESTDLFRTSYRLDPVDDQTRLTFAFELNRMEFFMRPFEKLIRVAIQDGAGRVVRNIKGLVERQPAQPGGAANA